MDIRRYYIKDYLENRLLIKNTGTCKACGKKVYWSREKVNSHKRSKNCSNIPVEELNFFMQTLPRSKKIKVEVERKNQIIRTTRFTDKESLTSKMDDENDNTNEELVLIPTMNTSPSSSEEQMPKTENFYEKEEKFIGVIYPNFKGISKLKLIEDIIELKRKNEILEDKVKTYAKAVNDLL
ncbi:unnamed protein product [Diamesa serratosioi]